MLKKYLNPEKLTTLLLYFSILVFLIAFNFQHNSPSGWYQQFLPNLNNRPLVDITFTDSLTGYAVIGTQASDTSIIVKTTNGGDNWYVLLKEYRKYQCFQFLDNATGYVAGGDLEFGQPYLIKTSNSGENWIRLNTPSSSSISGISVLNEDTIWIAVDSGFDGGIFRTTNGGVNWTYQGQQNNLIKRIYMYNRNLGFASSDSYLFRTTNSGLIWEQVLGQNGFRDIFFTDSLIGWKTLGDTMKFTTNSGLNWSKQTLQTGGNISSSYMSNFSNINKDSIWGVGGFVNYGPNGYRGILHFTTNQGQNWFYQIPDTSIRGGYSYIDFINRKIGWAYSSGISGIHTKTGGDTVFYTGIVNIQSEVPSGFKLYQNYPNPFNPRTVIRYDIFKASNVKLTVYDITGREQMKLVDQHQPVGTYEVDFMGKFSASGVYFYTLRAGDFVDTKKMVLIK